MKAAIALIVLGAFGLIIEGALVKALPPLLLPDIALLGTVGAALFLGGAQALFVLAGLGFAADLLAGAPLGLHPFALLLPFIAARLANGSLELRRGLPESVLVALLAPLFGILAALGLRFLDVPLAFGVSFWVGLAVQTVVNAAVAPAACALAETLASQTGDLDATRRGVAYVGAAPWAASRR